MNSAPNLGASFYKFLADDDFSSRLQIPTEFVNKYAEILHPKMTLRTDDHHKPGKLWRVGIQKVGRRHFFAEGWSKFAEAVHLKNQECIIFKFVGGSTFDVSVYETTGCKKDSFSGDEGGVPGNFPVKVKIEDEHEMDSNAVRTWKFSKELKHHHLTTRLPIPKRFAVGTGIATNRKIKLQDAKGRKWPVKVTDRNIGMYAMTAGWRHFLSGNNVVIGSIISFEFIPSSDNVIEALVIKNGTGKEDFIPANRGRGRPPMHHLN